ncbi:MAG: GTPase Era [Candidatus Amoebophilus sp.]
MHTSPHQAGFVTIVGKPNVGKSTLMNKLVGERLSIITPKAQTTRHSICGIVSDTDFQIIFTDTPGILKPAYELQESMMHMLQYALVDTDILLWLVDIKEKEVPPIVEKVLAQGRIPILLLINKIDLIAGQEALENLVQYWKEKVQVAQIIPVAALQGFHVDQILKHILGYLPEHPPYYPKDMLTDRPERFFVAEIIREQILYKYQQEIPYAVEVAIEEFKEEASLIRISAMIYVEKKSQKGILIGKQGESLKQVGIAARQALEQFLGKQVFLQQHVKVLPGWRSQNKLLQRFGYGS